MIIFCDNCFYVYILLTIYNKKIIQKKKKKKQKSGYEESLISNFFIEW